MVKLGLTRTALSGWALMLVAAAPASAEVTANVGWMSDYIFRGIQQNDSSAMGGVDWKQSGFYVGTWAADVGQGLEVDGYAGYGGSIGDITYGVGGTAYLYTDDFDDDYYEANLSLGWKIFSVSAAVGTYENFDGPTTADDEGPTGDLDYVFIAPRVDYKGFYGLVGLFSQDFDTTYGEIGYGNKFEPIGVDYKAAIIYTDDTAIKDFQDSDSGETSFMFTLSKTFKLLD